MRKWLFSFILMGGSLMAAECYTVVERDAITVMGIECRTSNDPERGPKEIPQHWMKFYQEGFMGRIPNKVSNQVIALYCDYEGDYTKPYSFVLGCAVTCVEEIPEGMCVKMIPKGSYAIFPVVGEYPKELVETWREVWRQDGELARTYTGDYELYQETFAGSPHEELEVCIAISNQ